MHDSVMHCSHEAPSEPPEESAGIDKLAEALLEKIRARKPWNYIEYSPEEKKHLQSFGVHTRGKSKKYPKHFSVKALSAQAALKIINDPQVYIIIDTPSWRVCEDGECFEFVNRFYRILRYIPEQDTFQTSRGETIRKAVNTMSPINSKKQSTEDQ